MKELHVLVKGRVQGVGFRQFTATTARKLGLVGTVRNCSDGSVECYVQGDAATLDNFLKAIARGPAFARVDNVDSTEVPASRYDGFAIVY